MLPRPSHLRYIYYMAHPLLKTGNGRSSSKVFHAVYIVVRPVRRFDDLALPQNQEIFRPQNRQGHQHAARLRLPYRPRLNTVVLHLSPLSYPLPSDQHG